MSRLRSVASRLHHAGNLAVAWSAQFDAECRRFDGSTDPGPWVAVAASWGNLGQIHDQSWALLRAAECHIATSERRSAATCLRQAGTIGEALAAKPLLSAVTDVVLRHRVDLELDGDMAGRPRSSHALALTDREIEVLTLVAVGRSNEEIGKELFISPKTASVHVSHILAKLGTKSRTEAAATAHRLRLLS